MVEGLRAASEVLAPSTHTRSLPCPPFPLRKSQTQVFKAKLIRDCFFWSILMPPDRINLPFSVRSQHCVSSHYIDFPGVACLGVSLPWWTVMGSQGRSCLHFPAFGDCHRADLQQGARCQLAFAVSPDLLPRIDAPVCHCPSLEVIPRVK